MQRKYDDKHSQTIVIIENAFDWLKGRFRHIKYIDAHMHRVNDIIKACCVLHNVSQ